MFDLKKIKKAYVIGIKGSGVIAVVEILHAMGVEITGSDISEKFFTDEILQRLGVEYFEKFSPENIPADIDLVIYSTAYNENNNVEFQEAERRNLEMISYPRILAELFNQRYGIAVCGTHGKTTTSAMLAHIMKEIGVDPGAIIGSRVINWEGNALSGKGEFFVAETDEFQNKLKLYDPKAVILTSLDWDHPDTYPTFNEYKQAFKDFVARIPKVGFLVVWAGSTDTLEISKYAHCTVLTYGISDESDYRISNMKIKDSESHLKTQIFNIEHKNINLGEFEISLVGKHNVLNACAAIVVCHKLNLDMEKVRKGLINFKGTKRRFEYIGQCNGAILIDDYGHHPEEIKVTLKGAREIYPKKKIIAIFHPHSYSRTEALFQEFSQSFDDADEVIILDIYGSARENSGKVNSKELVELINKYNHGKAEYVSTIDEVVEFLKGKVGKNDVVIAIGAGNVWEVVEKLREV
ncbi:MAG: UDP-N-acetylmuramate--L-alanine ligase [Candidatus Moraniibacteriota bacterium]